VQGKAAFVVTALSPSPATGGNVGDTLRLSLFEEEKKLALITELCSTYIEALCRMLRGKTKKADPGKRDERYH
jgi:hypothetical protein